jgi:dTDP-4-dehydrorhamnose reductase
MENKWCLLRLLITGASGLYGSKLAKLATERNHKVFSGYSQNQTYSGIPLQFDISNRNSTRRAFKEAKPEIVVHAAALTDVDKCETNKGLAWRINVEGTRNISEEAQQSGAFLIFVSTDYVFNGEKGRYKETDTPDPINYYGITKLKGEELVKETIEEYCIARASVIYGSTPAAGKINFALWLINKLKNNEQAKIVTDQWNSPTLNTNMAEMTTEIIERKLTGIYHISGATRISRYDFAKQVAKKFKLTPNLIKPIPSAEFTWVARRPKDSSLGTSKAQKTLKKQPLQINQALKIMKNELTQLHQQ